MFDENGNFIPVGSRPYQNSTTSAFTSPDILSGYGEKYAGKLFDTGTLLKPSTNVLQKGMDPGLDLDFGTAMAEDAANKAGVDFMGNIAPTASGESGFMNSLLGDKYMMSNITGLASTLMQAAALPSMLKNAKLQNKSLAFNLDTAKEEQARRNQNIASFNAPRTANPATERKISAFA